MTARRSDAADLQWMSRAAQLAKRGEGMTRPNPPVGCVIVRGSCSVGEGFHRKAGGPHAEIVALRKAGDAARGATLYVTLEPCSTIGRTSACTEAIVSAGVRRVITGSVDPNPRHAGSGLAWLRRQGIEVRSGVGRALTDPLLRPFTIWITQGRPFLTLKLATTVDGRIADAGGHSKWITGAKARARVQGLRRAADVIMVGKGTVLADNPSLTSRTRTSQPLYRLVVDSRGQCPLSCKLLSDDYRRRTIIATTQQCTDARRRGFEKQGATVWVLPERGGKVSLSALMKRLGREGMLHVLCEGGGTLAEGLIRAGIVDELKQFIAPKVLGGAGRPALGGGWTLARAPEFTFDDVERVGTDILVTAHLSAK